VLLPGSTASSLWSFAALHALAEGATVRTAPTSTGPAFARALTDTDVVHGVPRTVTDTLDVLEATGPGSVRTLVCGGAALPHGTRERATALGVSVVAYYGAVELSFVAVDVDGRGLRPFPQVEVDVRPVAGTGLGEVWVRSPWVADGYLAGVSGPMRRDGQGWVTVGDLADAPEPAGPGGVPGGVPGGSLVLRGRGDGAILTGAATVVPEDVECAVASVRGVRDVVVVGTPHPELGSVVTAVLRTDEHVTRTALVAATRDLLSPAQRPRRWVRVAQVPRTSSGKPARAVVAAALGEGAGSPDLVQVGWP
ncbi:hypothetical protein N869_11745, partial [Cellulomonas bogoriensis 69B4 = DSM 16987]